MGRTPGPTGDEGADNGLYARYALLEDGGRVPQSSAPATVQALIEAADVRPGHHVLEVGTGSGYSTAVLATRVGPHGRVVSLDVHQSLVERASRLLRADGLDHVEVHCRDARDGLTTWGAFDRLIAWATSPHLPAAWLEAVREDGLLVLPVAIAPVLGATAVALVRRVGGGPHVERLLHGGFVPLHGPTPEGVPDLATAADVAWSEDEGAPWYTTTWLSAAWLRPPSPDTPDALRRLVHTLAPTTPLLPDDDAAAAFGLFVLVTRLDAVVLQVPALGRAIGVGSRAGLAVQALDQHVTLSTSEDAAGRLREVAQDWRAAGRPDLADVTPRLRPDGPDWLVRLCLPPGPG